MEYLSHELLVAIVSWVPCGKRKLVLSCSLFCLFCCLIACKVVMICGLGWCTGALLRER